MKIHFNKTFHQLLETFNLSSNLTFEVEIPSEVQEILNAQIIDTQKGITLDLFGILPKPIDKTENQSIIEDQKNHFHVDWHIEMGDSKKEFMLGVKTIQLLAEKFRKENHTGIRFWYSYQTPELARLEEISMNMTLETEYYSSDRLSFYRLRTEEEVISMGNLEHDYCSILVIDI
jgi:hypothetical protein